VAGLMHLVLGTASLISLLVIGPRPAWRDVLRALRERNTLPDHSQAVCRESIHPLLDQEIEVNEEKAIRKWPTT
jgi:hypothetical protein